MLCCWFCNTFDYHGLCNRFPFFVTKCWLNISASKTNFSSAVSHTAKKAKFFSRDNIRASGCASETNHPSIFKSKDVEGVTKPAQADISRSNDSTPNLFSKELKSIHIYFFIRNLCDGVEAERCSFYKKKKCIRICETFKNMYIIINYIQNFCFLKCPAYIK